MAAHEAVKKRREEVFSLVQQGVSIEQLANTYGITTRQIANDLDVIRKTKAVDYSKIDLQGRLSEYNESARQRMTRIWAIISDKTATKKEITNALRLLQKEEELRIGRDQMAGILPKSDVNLSFNQFNLTTADSIKIEFQDIVQQEPVKVIDVEPVEEKDTT